MRTPPAPTTKRTMTIAETWLGPLTLRNAGLRPSPVSCGARTPPPTAISPPCRVRRGFVTRAAFPQTIEVCAPVDAFVAPRAGYRGSNDDYGGPNSTTGRACPLGASDRGPSLTRRRARRAERPHDSVQLRTVDRSPPGGGLPNRDGEGFGRHVMGTARGRRVLRVSRSTHLYPGDKGHWRFKNRPPGPCRRLTEHRKNVGTRCNGGDESPLSTRYPRLENVENG